MGRVLCALAAAVLLAPPAPLLDNDRVVVGDAPAERRDLDRVLAAAFPRPGSKKIFVELK